MKKVNTIFVIMITLCINLYAIGMTPNLNHSGYKKSSGNPFASIGYGGQCTSFVWGRAYEKLGISIKFNTTSGRDAKNWLKRVTGLKNDMNIQADSIAVWGGDTHNSHGHVAFIEKIENGYVYFNEANWDTFKNTTYGGGYDGKVKKWTLTKFKKYRSYAGNIIGYIHLTSNENSNSTTVDGSGSLIRPEILNTADRYRCQWGCYRDEADMQIHSSTSTVSFQWRATNSCKKLRIGVKASSAYRKKYKTWINPHNSLKVKIYRKAWNNDVVTEAFKTTLPKTVDYVDTWNNIIITSQDPLSEVQEIIAECTENDDGKDVTTLNKTLIELPLDYKFGGQSSIIRGSNKDYNKQADGIYQDVAIGLSDNKAMTLFQWQTSTNCKSLVLKSGQYPDGKGISTSVNGINIKSWNNPNWSNTSCNNKLPCTIKAPSTNNGKYGDYYIIKVKTNANTLDGNRISAVCTQ